MQVRKYLSLTLKGKEGKIMHSMLSEIDHFTVVCLVTWPVNESEAGVDLALIETSQLFLCKFLLISMTTTSIT